MQNHLKLEILENDSIINVKDRKMMNSKHEEGTHTVRKCVAL